MNINVTVSLTPKLEELLTGLFSSVQPSNETAAPSVQPRSQITGVPVQAQPMPPQQPQQPVPTATAPTYTQEQLARAAGMLMDAGKRDQLVGLLNKFGVQALTMLPKEHYGAFATELRQLGAQI